MEKLEDILKKYWGYDHFFPLQRLAIESLLKRKNVLLLTPTGSGKSVCFQLPILVQKGICLVVSPLISLMQDQVQQLKKKGIPAAAIHTGLHKNSIEKILSDAKNGKIKLLYLAPERLLSKTFQKHLPHLPFAYIAVDEAHCISTWGHDFRPTYRNISKIKEKISSCPIIALTATATPKVAEDILGQLKIEDAKIHQESYLRPEITYVVRTTSNKFMQLAHILNSIQGSAIIYLNQRSGCQQLADRLLSSGISATAYHAKLSLEERKKRQKLWMEEAQRVMVATNAFGMGIDKPNVRAVIHMQMPLTLEEYYQESGRAGRDRKKSYAIVLKSPEDIPLLKKRFNRSIITSQALKEIYQLLSNYFQVAVGSHGMIPYPFDMEDFVRHYNLSHSFVEIALRYLQTAGLIHYQNHGTRPAAIQIKLNSIDFYNFRTRNTTYAATLDALANLYSNKIMCETHPISLRLLSRKTTLSLKKIETDLKELDELKILDYSPPNHLAEIIFLTPRYPAENIPLPEKKIQEKIKIDEEKLSYISSYLTNSQICRSLLLVDYFGEKNTLSCKKCDLCLSKRQKDKTNNRYQNHILQVLEKGAHTPQELIQKIRPSDSKACINDLQNLLENHIIKYDISGQLIKIQK